MEIERGDASVTIELTGGTITVYHNSDGTILREFKNAKAGSWDEIFKAIDNIQIVTKD